MTRVFGLFQSQSIITHPLFPLFNLLASIWQDVKKWFYAGKLISNSITIRCHVLCILWFISLVVGWGILVTPRGRCVITRGLGKPISKFLHFGVMSNVFPGIIGPRYTTLSEAIDSLGCKHYRSLHVLLGSWLWYTLSTCLVFLVKYTGVWQIVEVARFTLLYIVAWRAGQFFRSIYTSNITGKLCRTSLFRSSGPQKAMLWWSILVRFHDIVICSCGSPPGV